MMRRSFVILSLAALLVSSCYRQERDDSGNVIPVDWNGYVYFGSDVSTRTPVITSMSGKSFGVVTFKYTSDWNTFKATGTPESSGQSSVPEGKYGFPCPTEVACDGTALCTYDASSTTAGTQLVEWESGKKYSFFAYYPLASSTNGVTMNSTASTVGAPTLTYTVPSWTDPSVLPDIMTASVIDATNNGDGTVGFTFSHRLCCIDVQARNLNNYVESVKNLKLNITTDVYTSVNISMDASAALVPSGTKSGGISYQIIADDESKKVTLPVITGSSSSTVNLSGDNNIIFIPQTIADKGKLSGSISFTNAAGDSKTQNFVSDKDFEAGKKYSFIISFADESISIAIIESGDWLDNNQDIIFE